MSIFDIENNLDTLVIKHELKEFLIDHSWYDVLNDDQADINSCKVSIVYYMAKNPEHDSGRSFKSIFHHTYKIVIENDRVKLKINPNGNLYILVEDESYSIPDNIMKCLEGVNIKKVCGEYFKKIHIEIF